MFPIVVGKRQWGECYWLNKGESYSLLLDNKVSEPVETIAVRSKAWKVLTSADCHRRVVKREARRARRLPVQTGDAGEAKLAAWLSLMP